MPLRVPVAFRNLVAVIAAASLAIIAGCRDRAKAAVIRQPDAALSRPALATAANTHDTAQPRRSNYRVVPLGPVGRISGVVEFAGRAPADSLTHPGIDGDVCGAGRGALADVSVMHTEDRLAHAIVWLNGVTSGKRLPVARRFDLVAQGCRFVPRTQAAVVGGTLDVRSADPVIHRTHLLRASNGNTVAVVGETEAGEVVPVHAALDIPGLLEIRCDRHSWMRAWVAVFDHPYYATTGPHGTFAIDSIPPGRYSVTVWHERFGALSDSVTVTAGQAAAVTLRYPATGTGG
jgi:hypothetical protein